MGPLFIWLGSGRARRRKIDAKGLLLDQAARAGLTVPAGAILPDEMYRIFLDKELLIRQADRVVIPDPELFHNTLIYSVRLPPFERPAAIRTAFHSDPKPISAWLNVDMNDAGQVSRALAALWTAVVRLPAARADLMVMEMVVGEHAGTAITGRLDLDDAVTVTLGMEHDRPLVTLPPLTGRRSPAEELPPFGRRLQMLLRGVRRTFGKGVWEIEWIDDGQICHLIQLTALRSAA